MPDKINFNNFIIKMENKFFVKQKKNTKFVKNLLIYFKYRRSYVYIYSKFQEYWEIFLRFESLFGRLPKINSLKQKRKGKLKKKIIFLRAFIVVKSVSFNEKLACNILDYIFYLHNYSYLKLFINKKQKVGRYEEIIACFTGENVYLQHNSIMFENNLFFKWLDLSRNFIDMKELKHRIFKRQYKQYYNLKRLKFYDSKIVINSNYFKFFILPLKILVKNYKKLVIFLFKKFRSRRRSEKAYILL